jgi:hypothetical protein
VVVAAVSVDPPGALQRSSGHAPDRRDRLDERDELGDVVGLPPVRVTASGSPFRSQIRWCLEPVLARSTGLGPVCSPLLEP